MSTDLEIARTVALRPILEVAAAAGIPADAVFPHGRHVAKLDLEYLETLSTAPRGKLVLVTAINPTPPGEGKTTTTIGLGDALNRIGRRAVVALREPSLGPVFGRKGGATGGGRAQAAPMEAINLHLTGDFHAVTAAHNLLAALLDNHLYWGNALRIDPKTIVWRRVMDCNDRALRRIVVGLGEGANGSPRETGFDITVASEVMAVLCLSDGLKDLQARLGRIVVARDLDGRNVTAKDLKADGALTALLKDAVQPNLVQSLEGAPILVHGGPFANIAHGCNSVIATRAALALGAFAVTEAGFGADLGAEKFFDIKCRSSGLRPDAVVLVATLRALKHHGGAKGDLSGADAEALERGLENLGRHLENLALFGAPAVVAINHFSGDRTEELDQVLAFCRERHGTRALICRHWAEGGAGAEDLARAVVAATEEDREAARLLYSSDLPLRAKIETVAEKIYRAGAVRFEKKALKDLQRFEADGFGALPVCIAKTPYSFSTDEALVGAPEGHVLPVKEVRLSAGAGFVVVLCGEVMTMPGLPRVPSAEAIGLDEEGRIAGLF